ncbi:Transcriptional regulator, HxlR family [Sphingomonas paucimobilis]|nr:Transcriptional regulator, HxlR family [Sphingomonas paucimobilis]
MPQDGRGEASTSERIDALEAEMARHGSSRDGPVRTIFALLGDRWTNLIVLLLWIDDFRHAELRRLLTRLSPEGSISQRIMTLKLRQLERNGLVSRSISGDVPPKVSYALTPLGRELASHIHMMIDWTTHHQTVIEEARALWREEAD